MKVKKVYFEKFIEESIVSHIRKNIYSKYPKRALSKSNYWNTHIKIKIIPIEEGLSCGRKSKIYKYTKGCIFELYFKDALLVKLNHVPKFKIHYC